MDLGEIMDTTLHIEHIPKVDPVATWHQKYTQ